MHDDPGGGCTTAERTPLPAEQITGLLAACRSGDRSAEQSLLTLLYPLLREIAAAEVRRHAAGGQLGPTELLHEAYERLFRACEVDWASRAHFYAVATVVLRRAVVDHLRHRSADKRGGGVTHISLDQLDGADPAIATSGAFEILALDEALTDLAEHDPAGARVIELRAFAGLSIEQIANICDSSVATVGRQLRFARAWLSRRLEREAT